MARGIIAIDQIQTVDLQGDGIQIATTNGTFTAGNVPVYDSTGKLVDSGISASSGSGATPILDADGTPIFDANGNWIFPS